MDGLSNPPTPQKKMCEIQQQHVPWRHSQGNQCEKDLNTTGLIKTSFETRYLRLQPLK